jgi:microcystin-dependent protein
VQNATTGAFALLMKTSGGTTVCIPRGTFKDIIINAGGVLRVDANDVGEIKFFAGASVPAGYYECDGSAISRASNPDLFAAIGTTHGSGNGATTFNLPDLKTSGRFLRSRSASVAAGIYQNADIAAHNHTATGSTTITSITIAADGAFSPTITINDPTHGHIVSTSSDGGTGIKERNQDGGGSGIRVLNYTSGSAVAFLAAASATGISATSTSIGNHSHSGSSATATTTVTVNNSTGTETRPVNASAIACIRY